MAHNIFKLMLAISVLSNVSPSLADENQASSEATSEAPGFLSTPAPSSGSLVNRAIQNDPHLSNQDKNVNVTNKDGRVVVTGTVPTNADKEKINSALIESGAPNVSNEVKVQASSTASTKKQATPKMKIIQVR